MEKFGDSIESRRFVSHNDSCMSFLQFQIRKESIYINVIWRSSEVSKMLPVDFKSLKYIIKEFPLSYYLTEFPLSYYNNFHFLIITISTFLLL